MATATGVLTVPATDDVGLSLLVYVGGVVQVHPLDDAPIELGRSRSCRITIEHPSVSRRHATLELEPLTIADVGSHNGTRVRGQAIAPGVVTPLEPGDVVQLGDVVVVVNWAPTPTVGEGAAASPWASLDHRLAEECARSARSGARFAHLRLIVAADQAAAARVALTAALRTSDVLAEDELGSFQLLMPDTVAARSITAQQRLVGSLAALGIAARAGLATYPSDGATGEQLSARAWQLATAGAGAATAMDEVRSMLARIAPSDISVLIIGETGVGKELYAEMLHRSSARSARPFIRLNCAAIAASVLEAELFGHERGAFTGATSARAGLFEAADGGTLFLDEIGELPLGIQSTLLRVLEERRVRPIGSNEGRPIDVRFVCATNRVLADEIAARRFRQDLYFRISGVTLSLPSLRERRDEIRGLCRAFANRARRPPAAPPRLSAAALDVLVRAPWPGNVRELRNTIERAVLLAGAGEVEPRHLLLDAQPPPPSDETTDTSHRVTQPGLAAVMPPPGLASTSDRPLANAVADTERHQILEVLARCGGNQTRAAQILGISRNTLLARLDAFGITRPRKK
ncbi:MAG: sigma 54-interacting transcriptional regulator [Deltaproteobacteria bacterium]|nr:sigma 54-interacting transcriptional regulator [Deltaproteobacteria bacterium]